jgi:outer membrane protein OmpA-like peptidoglycan-associated protein
MTMWRRKVVSVGLGLVLIPMTGIVGLSGCSIMRENPKATKGTAIGALAGAATGAGLGALAGGGRGAAIGAGIGAGVGAVTGGLAGHYMDTQERELREIMAMNAAANDRITRLEDELQMSLASDTLFDYNKATLQPGAQSRLVRFGQSLSRNDRTDILVIGHTDSTGSDQYNQGLSEARAATVRNVLIDTGVSPARITTRGDGEHNPVATNSTAEGRAANRRVEIAIVPNDGLRREAAAGAPPPPPPGYGY